MKVQVKRAFQSYSFSVSLKNNKKDRLFMKVFSTLIQMCRSASIPYFKVNAHFYFWILFFKKNRNPPGQDQQNAKQT